MVELYGVIVAVALVFVFLLLRKNLAIVMLAMALGRIKDNQMENMRSLVKAV